MAQSRLVWAAAMAGAALFGCRSSSKASAAQIDLGKVALTYRCGNQFQVTNGNAQGFTLTWRVDRTTDQGSVAVPAQSSVTFTTYLAGTVLAWVDDAQLQAANTSVTCGGPPGSTAPPGPGFDSSAVKVAWSCGNDFTVTNGNATGFNATWSVENTYDQGVVAVPGASGGASGTASFTTNQPGTVLLTYGGLQIEVGNGGKPCSTPPPPPPPAPTVDPAKVSVAYTCGNGFAITNANALGFTLSWAVEGTSEHGTVAVPPAGDGGDGAATFTTQASGTVQASFANAQVEVPNGGQDCAPPPPPPPPSDSARLGSWGPLTDWPVVPIHVAELPDGKLIAWSRLEQPTLWDPAANTFTEVPAPSWIFCAGLTLLADGKLLVVGGHISDDHGLPDTNLFDPFTGTWTKQPQMATGRWYPAALTLADGSVLAVGGTQQDGSQNLIPEVRNPDGSWRQLPGANLQVPYFPRMFVAPNGQPYMAGSPQLTRFLDITGQGRWITGPTSNWGIRDYGSAVMYEPGKILFTGGGLQPPTSTAEIIDLNQAKPAWQYTGSMSAARRQHNATVLPDGKVVVMGGTKGAGFNDESSAVLSAELWDPATGKFTLLPSQSVPRVYHSTALLLPDGRVMSGGGGEGGGGVDRFNVEIYSPAYLFNNDGSLATRPTISGAPDSSGYGATFSVASPDAASIAQVVLIRLATVTHSYSMNQRRVPLQFTAAGGALTVTAPAGPNVAPPGYYWLFLVDSRGVPSIAKTLRLDLP